MVERFLTEFYSCLRFSLDKAFPAERFANLFSEHAMLIEHSSKGFQKLTVQEFIASMNDYQKQMTGSFEENQIDFQVMDEEGVLIVDSNYEKKIDDKIFTGTNHMILTENEGILKIISIVF